ncbi:MAG TPA: DNA-3-methyladenine glycosylase 2 family protein [Actinomycetota bacterium]|nr:DNA-3-methyladenine glycosylase 2 family protein [Actinomycetota bacterium]
MTTLAGDCALQTSVRVSLPLDLRLSLSALRHGPGDPTIRLDSSGVWRATRMQSGPATMHLSQRGSEVDVRAWGPGAAEALDSAPALVGARDDLGGWNPRAHPLVHELHRRMEGMRMISSGRVLEAAVPAVIEQKVTSHEAHAAWRRMVMAWGDPAPGPGELKLMPSPEMLGAQPYWAFHRHGVERRRADVIRSLAARSRRVEEAAIMPKPQARGRLEAFSGVGPWTSAEVARVCWGDADAVSVGDYHVGPVVVYALTGRRGGDDDAMLELLEPFRPHSARAANLIMLGGPRPPRRAPKARLRDFRQF